ncbi:MAG: hypothetical protein JXA10_07445 [Anaerolineae bacterium]|nr:hypothetical protein [Anaerolineae bacterium]
MGIKVSWDNPETKKIIRYDFEPIWTAEEFFAALREDDELLLSVDHLVHLMFDMRRTENVPYVPVTKLREVAAEIKRETGLIVLVGANMWLNVLADVFQKVYASRIEHFAGLKHARTPDHAYEIIAEYEQEQAV